MTGDVHRRISSTAVSITSSSSRCSARKSSSSECSSKAIIPPVAAFRVVSLPARISTRMYPSSCCGVNGSFATSERNRMDMRSGPVQPANRRSAICSKIQFSNSTNIRRRISFLDSPSWANRMSAGSSKRTAVQAWTCSQSWGEAPIISHIAARGSFTAKSSTKSAVPWFRTLLANSAAYI